jgi:hypothetical protein
VDTGFVAGRSREEIERKAATGARIVIDGGATL